MELYMSDNQIQEVMQARQLAPLSRLLVLDLSGNPLAQFPDFRPYVVHLMPRLKVQSLLPSRMCCWQAGIKCEHH